MNERFDLTGRSVIITGGGKGIGKVYAQEFAKAGARVVAADIDGAAAKSVAEALAAQGFETIGLATDIASEDSTKAMAQAALERFGAIDVLINNASLMSVLPRRSWLEIPIEEWDRVMAVNLRGMFLSCRAVFPAMKAQQRGKIVNISSSRVWEGTPNRLHYTTSKAGVIGFTRALAREVGELGITVNAVTPGMTQSETQVQSSSANYLATRVAGRAIERVQIPADLVGAVMFLSSAASDFMTGQTINGRRQGHALGRGGPQRRQRHRHLVLDDVFALERIELVLVHQALALGEIGHQFHRVAHMSFAPKVAQRRLHALERRLQGDVGVDHPGIAQFFEPLVGQFRRASTEHDVEELRPRQAAGDIGDLLHGRGRFDEGDVGAGLPIGRGALERGGIAFWRNGVSARDDQEIAVAAGVDGGFDLLHHLGGRDHVFAREMAAALGKDLVLDLQGIGARALEQGNGAHHVHGIAEAGVGIDHERARECLADCRHVRCELAHRYQADVGDAEKRVGDAGAGDIGGRKALIGDDARRQRIGDARQQQRRAGDEHVAKLTARHGARHRSVLSVNSNEVPAPILSATATWHIITGAGIIEHFRSGPEVSDRPYTKGWL